MDEECEKLDRDPSTVEITVFVNPSAQSSVKESIELYGEAGADRLVFTVGSTPEEDPYGTVKKIASGAQM
ncbi:uncharacterized protein METZ01_LOCUS365731 [marine metagenome]|uniref:Uncharacterized protein n=1 Tax=marine metagenome TaxID=408172 RepID=A0A382SUI1_9ZZZZ